MPTDGQLGQETEIPLKLFQLQGNIKRKILVVLLSLLPIILIFGLGSIWTPTTNVGSTLSGRPPNWVFGVAWAIITIAWTVSLYIASTHMSTKSYIYFIVLSTIVAILCVIWLGISFDNKTVAAPLLILINFISFITLVFTMLTNYKPNQHRNAKLLCGLGMVPLSIWTIFICFLNYLDIN